MRIELDKLEQTGNALAHTYEPEEIVLDEEHARLTEPLAVSIRLARIGTEVRLLGRIDARAEVDCDRCLRTVAVPINAEFDVKYIPAEDYRSNEAAELQEEDLSVSVFEDETIDIDDLVREQVLLALPVRALCGDECKGLCPVCGTDRNTTTCNCESSEIDPRWAGLLKTVTDDK